MRLVSLAHRSSSSQGVGFELPRRDGHDILSAAPTNLRSVPAGSTTWLSQ